MISFFFTYWFFRILVDLIRFFDMCFDLASILVFQAMPFVVVAILGFVVVELRAFIKTAKGHHEGGGGRAKWFSMKAYPILIGRPFSVLTLAELLTILGVLLLVLYHFGRLNHIAFARINANLTTYRRAKAASQ